MHSITLRSPAKINLGLWVGARRPDGFHEIITTMVPLEFGDRVTVKRAETGIKLKITGIKLNIPANNNLAYRAAELFFKATGINAGCSILIHKRIPPGSGLGGGSSNAAAVISGLARLYDRSLNRTRLRNLALQLGSDVPFFLKGNPCVARGRGEKLRPINLPRLLVLLYCPGFSIATAWAYQQLDRTRRNLTAPLISPKILGLKLRRKELAGVAAQVYNSFESVVFLKYPELARIKTLLLNRGAYAASLSGSGSTVYGLLNVPDPMAELINSGLPWILTRSRPSVRLAGLGRWRKPHLRRRIGH